MNSLDGIEILQRTTSGPWYTIRGVVQGKIVSVDVPKSRFDGLAQADAELQMKRALRSGLPYAERDA